MSESNYEYLIIGAGPAGLQLGYFLEKNQRDYLILERWHKPGKFFEKFPRHRMLISINKVYTGKRNPEINLRWDWNSLLSDDPSLLFKNYNQSYFPHPDDLVRYLGDFAEHFQLKIKYNTRVNQVSKKDGIFIVTDAEGNTYTGQQLVIATGFTKEFEPDFPGHELCATYANHSTDLEEYKDKRVLVVGKGNSGFETADHLIEVAAAIHILSPESVSMAWETHFVGNLRAVNNNFLDTYQLKSQNTVIDATINKVEREGEKYRVHISYSHAKGQTRELTYDKVILCTGFRFDDSIFDDTCRPDLVHKGKLPAQTPEWESVNVPGLYFAGTLMQACDFKKTMSGFIHGFRYNVRALSNILERKYHGVEWPCERFEATPEAVLSKVIERLNNGSGIFLQPGFLQDLVVIQDGMAEYYTDLRADYIPFSEFSQREHYYTISLEYGHFVNPFNTERDPSPDMAMEAAYLHPIIRRFSFGKPVTEHHIQDDLESEWYLEEYVEPARVFFNAQLAYKLEPQESMD
ncbi:MAG TPA: NAD(P)-binding domain-containing protein [Anaerolineales bacterium]|nr:NAD(P)-binding domain-containing protein [Anaerolineales bacterium]